MRKRKARATTASKKAGKQTKNQKPKIKKPKHPSRYFPNFLLHPSN